MIKELPWRRLSRPSSGKAHEQAEIMRSAKPAKRSSRRKGESTPQWRLRLYVAGSTPKSMAAFANLKEICERHLGGRYSIEIIDLLQNPQLAARGFFHPAETSDGHSLPCAGLPFSGLPEPAAPNRPPRLGEHTDVILSSLLGLSDSEIGRLRDDGIV